MNEVVVKLFWMAENFCYLVGDCGQCAFNNDKPCPQQEAEFIERLKKVLGVDEA